MNANHFHPVYPQGSGVTAEHHMGIFSFLKKKDKAVVEQQPSPAPDDRQSALPGDQIATSESLDNRLEKSRNRFTAGLLEFLGGRTSVDEELLEELETQLIMSCLLYTSPSPRDS